MPDPPENPDQRPNAGIGPWLLVAAMLVVGTVVFGLVQLMAGSMAGSIFLCGLLFFLLPASVIAVIALRAAGLLGRTGHPRRFRLKLWHLATVVAGSAIVLGAARVAVKTPGLPSANGSLEYGFATFCTLLTVIVVLSAIFGFPLFLVVKLGVVAKRSLEGWETHQGGASRSTVGWLSALLYLIMIGLYLIFVFVMLVVVVRILGAFDR